MRSVVVTSFSAEGQALYGDRCLKSLTRHWPGPVSVYLDEPSRYPDADVQLTRDIPGWTTCRAQLLRENPTAAKPTNYIWDAQRFAVKPFVWLDAAERLTCGVLVWLDGDTVTRAAVPDGFAESLLDDADVAYLGRGAMHPETGFVAFRIPEALPLLRWCCDVYQSGAYALLRDGWTDCHVLRAGLQSQGVSARNLTLGLHDGPWNSGVDAMGLSPLGPYVTHFKGSARKRALAHA